MRFELLALCFVRFEYVVELVCFIYLFRLLLVFAFLFFMRMMSFACVAFVCCCFTCFDVFVILKCVAYRCVCLLRV